MTKEIKCPECGAKEISSMTPKTVYKCGSSDYDQRQGSFVRSEECKRQNPSTEKLQEILNRIIERSVEYSKEEKHKNRIREDLGVENFILGYLLHNPKPEWWPDDKYEQLVASQVAHTVMTGDNR